MAGKDAIQVEGRVVEAPAKDRLAARKIAPGDTVTVEVSPFDLSKGRLVR
jgi:translation initiation factor IF-1